MFVQYITTIQINLRIYQRETNIFLSLTINSLFDANSKDSSTIFNIK